MSFQSLFSFVAPILNVYYLTKKIKIMSPNLACHIISYHKCVLVFMHIIRIACHKILIIRKVQVTSCINFPKNCATIIKWFPKKLYFEYYMLQTLVFNKINNCIYIDSKRTTFQENKCFMTKIYRYSTYN